MTRAGLLSILGVAAALIAACSSSSTDKKKGSGGASASNVLNTGANGSSSSVVEATTNGMKELTADQAAAVKDPAGACQGWVAEPEGGPAVLEFVVDTTQSMTESTTSTGGRSKWQVLQEVLPQALATLPDNWSIGLSFYCRSAPNVQNGCFLGSQNVPIAALTDQQLGSLQTAIQQRTTCTYTPSQVAWEFGFDNIQQYQSGNRYVVLMTDGIPTVNADGCTIGGDGNQNIAISQAEYDGFVNAVADRTASTGIKTFVVGVPGSEAPQGALYDPMYQLSRLAEAGQTAKADCSASSGTSNGTQVNPRGTYCHYDMTQDADFAAGLRATIVSIGDSVVSCDYTVPPAPDGKIIDPATTNMVYDNGDGTSYLILRNNGADCTRGWQFTDSTNQNIHICQVTCDELQANPKASITAVFGCTDWATVA